MLKLVGCTFKDDGITTPFTESIYDALLLESEILQYPNGGPKYHINTAGVAEDKRNTYGHWGRIKITTSDDTTSVAKTYSIPIDLDTGRILTDHKHFYKPKDPKFEDSTAVEVAGAFTVFAKEELKAKFLKENNKTDGAVKECEKNFKNLSSKDIKRLYRVSVGKEEYNADIEKIIKDAKGKNKDL